MRLFLVSYQKSGTHQIMPALHIDRDIVDRSYNELTDIPYRYRNGNGKAISPEGVEETCQQLRTFGGFAFGHLSYLPEYAEAMQTDETKVLFNVRDPRDIIVSEFYSASMGRWPNLFIEQYGKRLSEMDDPISELIELAAARWPKWIGWLNHSFVMKVKYEDLRLNGAETVYKMSEFLCPIEIDRNACVRKLSPGPKNPTFRRGVPGEWKEVFTDGHKKKAELLLGSIIETLGYEL